MRALSVVGWGAAPELGARPEPGREPGRALVRMSAAALNPVDVAIASGRFYMALPDPPFVAGAEAVGTVMASERLAPGTRVWGLTMTGAFGEVVSLPEECLVPLPDGLADAPAAALGIAGLAGWMPVRDRGRLAPGETVVVLGAGGAVGRVALQAARSGGASRIVGVARSAEGRARALAHGADVALPIDDDLPGALRQACGGAADLVVDAVWGAAAVAALGVLGRGGRLVQVGNASGPVTEVTAGPLRGGRLDLLGFSVFSEEPAELARAYAALAAAAAAGEVVAEVEEVPFADAPAAFARQAAGTDGAKLVLVAER